MDFDCVKTGEFGLFFLISGRNITRGCGKLVGKSESIAKHVGSKYRTKVAVCV
jgi:hypothetical protein